MTDILKAPFPWFGGKSKVAPLVWERFGDVANYVEPFFGSGAVLLGRPHEPGIETVNDLDGLVCNFWRALQADPDEVARWADNPVNENDLHAVHIWLKPQRAELSARLEADPDYYDAKIAGRWVWGIACWIGSGWCEADGPWHVENGLLVNDKPSEETNGTKRQMPHLGNAGRGVNRKRPHLGNAGRGVNRKRPQLRHGGAGINTVNGRLCEYMRALANRLCRVRVCCGDWSRICGPTPTFGQGLTGVFLDPPYSHDLRNATLYTCETDCSTAVREWAIANGDNPLMRIALCGYDGEHEMPDSWDVVEWKAGGGYEGQGKARSGNRHKERIWFSPACLKPATVDQHAMEF